MTRFGYVMATYVAAMTIGGLAFVPPTPILIWNATASAPIGLYRVRPAAWPRAGDLVAVETPRPFARLFEARGYIPAGVPLIKHVAAIAGQTVCRAGDRLTIDGQAAARALDQDRRGRPLPVWRGCVHLQATQVFLLNGAPDSLDGRYFGATPLGAVVGRLTPLVITGRR